MRNILLLLITSSALTPCGLAQSYFTLAPTGCSGIHCTAHEDDAAGIMPPINTFGFLFTDTTINSYGSGESVGCSGNGQVWACIYVAAQPLGRMYAYGPTGTILWTDQTNGTYSLGAGVCNAPVVGSDGGVMMADYNNIIRLGPTGALLWKTALPYSGGQTSASGAFGPDYACGGLKVMANGAVVIKTIKGPLAVFNSATGALIGPAACNPAITPPNPTCALWPGQAPGTFSATADYYIPVKEGGCSDTNRVYSAMQGTDGGGTPAILNTTGVLMGIDVSLATGMSVGATSTTFAAESVSSPMCATVSSKIVVYSDTGSCYNPPACTGTGINSAVMAWVDNGTSFSTQTGFPIKTAILTAATGALSITGGTFNNTASTVTFNLTGSTSGCVAGNAALIAGNSVGAYDRNFAIAAGGVTGSSVTITYPSPTSAPGANGTLTCNNAGNIQANYALDSRGCFWTYVSGNSEFFCIDTATGAVDYSLATPAGFILGEIALTGGSDRTMSINPTNGHNIMVCALNGNSSWVVGLDMNTGTLLWYYKNGATTATNNAGGQFPPLPSALGFAEVGFSNSTRGMTILGQGGTQVAPKIMVRPGVAIK